MADGSTALHRAAPHLPEWVASLPRERDLRPGNELHERESELDERAVKWAITQVRVHQWLHLRSVLVALERVNGILGVEWGAAAPSMTIDVVDLIS